MIKVIYALRHINKFFHRFNFSAVHNPEGTWRLDHLSANHTHLPTCERNRGTRRFDNTSLSAPCCYYKRGLGENKMTKEKSEQKMKKKFLKLIERFGKRKSIIIGVKVLNENTENDFKDILEKGVDAIHPIITPEEVEKRFQIRKELCNELKQELEKLK
jgi:hypothetical protein